MILDAVQAFPPNYPVHIVLDNPSDLTSADVAEWILNIATLIIAIGGLAISYIVYRKEKSDAEALNDSSRKLELFKTLVLDHIMVQFHEIYASLKESTDQLLYRDYDLNHRSETEVAVQAKLRKLNDEVLSLIRAINLDLYTNLLRESDTCRDKIIEQLSEESIALHHEENYKSHILAHIINARNAMIKYIYDYKG